MGWSGWLERWRGRRLAAAQAALLAALWDGRRLKSHRTLDGGKSYQLHGVLGVEQAVSAETVHYLRQAGYIETNHKFPVATYWLTEKGKAHAADVVKNVRLSPVDAGESD